MNIRKTRARVFYPSPILAKAERPSSSTRNCHCKFRIAERRSWLHHAHRVVLLFAAAIAPAAPGMAQVNLAATHSAEPSITKLDSDGGRTSHARAQQAVRDNRLKDALVLLTRLRLDYPENTAYLFDYIAVSSWSGEHSQALREGEVLLQRADTPLYVLEGLAVSARETKRLPLALAAYDAVLAREPARTEARLGRARVLLEGGDVQRARKELLSLQQSAPERTDVAELLTRSYEAESDWISLLTAAQDILRRAPESEAALRMRFLALIRLGAPHLALAITPSAAVAPDDRTVAERDRIALDLRWARVTADEEHGAARWYPTDAAIAEAARTAQTLAAKGYSADARRQQFDLLVGLGRSPTHARSNRAIRRANAGRRTAPRIRAPYCCSRVSERRTAGCSA